MGTNGPCTCLNGILHPERANVQAFIKCLRAENETLRARCEAYEDLRHATNVYINLVAMRAPKYDRQKQVEIMARCEAELEALEDVCGK